MMIPKTLKDAVDNGYVIAEKTHTRGYISRRIIPAYQPVKVAGVQGMDNFLSNCLALNLLLIITAVISLNLLTNST